MEIEQKPPRGVSVKNYTNVTMKVWEYAKAIAEAEERGRREGFEKCREMAVKAMYPMLRSMLSRGQAVQAIQQLQPEDGE